MPQRSSASPLKIADGAVGHPLRSNAGLCFHAGELSESPDRPGSLAELGRFVVTCAKNRHQFFWFLEDPAELDPTLVCIASDSAFHLGVVSSMIHITWVRAAGGRLHQRPVYSKTACFDPFPFPDPAPELRAQISELAERLDRHRKDAIARDERVTMTGIYEVVTRLRSNEIFTPAERAVHQIIAGRALREMHQELDRLVARAYGWRWPMNKPEILSKLVELLETREAEERAGKVRWLRPDYQIPRFSEVASEMPRFAG